MATAIAGGTHVRIRVGRGTPVAGPVARFPLVASERRGMSLARIIEVGVAPAASSRNRQNRHSARLNGPVGVRTRTWIFGLQLSTTVHVARLCDCGGVTAMLSSRTLSPGFEVLGAQ